MVTTREDISIPVDDPPPYTPTDPNVPAYDAPPSPVAATSPSVTPPPPVDDVPTLRGGFLRRRSRDRDNDSVTSPTSYFEERAYDPQNSLSLVVVERVIHPNITREELSLPLSIEECQERDLVDQDWDTFVNFLLSELNRRQWASDGCKSQHWGMMTAEEFFQCKLRMEPVVAEWNTKFFMSRGVHVNARFSYDSPDGQQLNSPLSDEKRALPSNEERPEPPQRATYASTPVQADESDLRQPDSSWRGPVTDNRPSYPEGLYRQPSYASSSSSLDSISSVSIISLDALSNADLEQARDFIAEYRRDPDRRSHMATAVTNLLRNIKNARNKDYRRRMLPKEDYRSAKQALRSELKEINGEIKQFNAQRKSERKSLKLARRMDKAQRKREKSKAKVDRKIQRKMGKVNSKAQRCTSNDGGSHADLPNLAKYDGPDGPVFDAKAPLTPTSDADQDESLQDFLIRGGSELGSLDLNRETIVPPHIEARLRRDSTPSVEYRQLTIPDRILQTKAQVWEGHARHWAKSSAHWGKKWYQWAAADDRREEMIAFHAGRRDAALAEQIARLPVVTGVSSSCDPRRERLDEKRRKDAERAEQARRKRREQRVKVKKQYETHALRDGKISDDCEAKAQACRAKMQSQKSMREKPMPQAYTPAESSRAAMARDNNYFERMGRDFGEWGQSFGQSMEAWGESFGRDMQLRGMRLGEEMQRRGEGMQMRGDNFGKQMEQWAQSSPAIGGGLGKGSQFRFT